MSRPDPAIDSATGEVRAEFRCSRGCNARWSCDFGYGRLCSDCDRRRYEGERSTQRQKGLPEFRTPPSRPHTEVNDDAPMPF